MPFVAINNFFKQAWRIISLRDIRHYLKFNQKIRVGCAGVINILGSTTKVMASLTLAKSIEELGMPANAVVAPSYNSVTLLYASVIFNFFTLLIPEVRKFLLYGIQEDIAQKASKKIVICAQTLSITKHELSLNSLWEETSKHIFCANNDMPKLVSAVIENMQPLFFDIGISVVVASCFFDVEAVLFLIGYTGLSVLTNILLFESTNLGARTQAAERSYLSYITTIFEVLYNTETVHLSSNNSFELQNIKIKHQKHLILKKSNFFYERLWIIPSIFNGILYYFATSYIRQNAIDKLSVDDMIFIFNYIINIGGAINSLNNLSRLTVISTASINEVDNFLRQNSINEQSSIINASPTQITPLLTTIVVNYDGTNQENYCNEQKSYRLTPTVDIKQQDYNLSITNDVCAVEFENVSFAYPSGKNLLTAISFKIDIGSKVAIVGPSGKGKTTITKLICGFIEPTNVDAKIKIFGHDIRTIPRSHLWKLMGVVRQQTELFTDESVKYNVLYGTSNKDMLCEIKHSKNYSGQEVNDKYVDVIQKTNLQKIANNLTCQGLSGGEKQRIGIARVLIKNSKIFFFDEPTSQVDSITEKHVLKNIKTATKGKTVIMIAHRLSTIKDADKIIILGTKINEEASTILEQGTHSELLTSNGVYNNLWRLQTS